MSRSRRRQASYSLTSLDDYAPARQNEGSMHVFQPFVFLVCIATSFVCMWLLFRGWRRTGTRLLFWSALCFVFLAANNVLVFVDLIVFPQIDLRAVRLLTSLCAVTVLLWGLVWEAE